jgi:hypothetical protein
MSDSSIQAKRRNAAFGRLEGLWLTNCDFLISFLRSSDLASKPRSRLILKSPLPTRRFPFLISVGTYGGGGYMTLFANDESIFGFKAPFEFDGVSAFAFGPMT